MRGPAPPPEVATRSERRIEGIITCRSRRLDPREATVVLGIPVTTVARTLVDLAAVLGAGALARACHEAGVLHRTTPGEVEAVLARRPRSPGAGRLRAVLRGDVKVTLSTLERSFLRMLRAEGLPLPVTNRPAGGRRVDCRWPEFRLTVELDSYRSTAPGTRGSRTAGASARRTPAATISAATPTATSARSRDSCSPNSEICCTIPSWCRHTTPGQDASPPRQARSPGRGCGRPSGARRSGRGRRR